MQSLLHHINSPFIPGEIYELGSLSVGSLISFCPRDIYSQNDISTHIIVRVYDTTILTYEFNNSTPEYCAGWDIPDSEVRYYGKSKVTEKMIDKCLEFKEQFLKSHFK